MTRQRGTHASQAFSLQRQYRLPEPLVTLHPLDKIVFEQRDTRFPTILLQRIRIAKTTKSRWIRDLVLGSPRNLHVTGLNSEVHNGSFAHRHFSPSFGHSLKNRMPVVSDSVFQIVSVTFTSNDEPSGRLYISGTSSGKSKLYSKMYVFSATSEECRLKPSGRRPQPRSLSIQHWQMATFKSPGIVNGTIFSILMLFQQTSVQQDEGHRGPYLLWGQVQGQRLHEVCKNIFITHA